MRGVLSGGIENFCSIGGFVKFRHILLFLMNFFHTSENFVDIFALILSRYFSDLCI
jgi:hypothetical protein